MILGCSCVMLVKDSAVHPSRQQWFVVGWLGPSVTVRVRVRARAREWCFFSLLFFFIKSDILVYMSDLNIELVRHPGVIL